MSTIEEIKPCPVCNVKGEWQMVTGRCYSVKCHSCLMVGPEAENREWAVYHWNALSRREDFYAELMELINIGGLMLPPSENGVAILGMIEELAKKYAPEEDEDDQG